MSKNNLFILHCTKCNKRKIDCKCETGTATEMEKEFSTHYLCYKCHKDKPLLDKPYELMYHPECFDKEYVLRSESEQEYLKGKNEGYAIGFEDGIDITKEKMATKLNNIPKIKEENGDTGDVCWQITKDDWDKLISDL